MHKAILFDLGRVLIHFDFRRGYRALEGLCPYAAEEIPRRLAGTGLVERFETGLVEPRDFVDQICQTLDMKVDYDQFRVIWSSIFTEVLIPESMLEGLKRRYRLVLVSNTNALHFEMIRRDLRSPVAPLRRSGAVVRSPRHEAAAGNIPGGGGTRGMPARGVLLYGRYRGVY